MQLSYHSVAGKSKTSAVEKIGTSGDSIEFVPPQPLSPEEVKLITDQCDQRFIKLHVSRILEDQVFIASLSSNLCISSHVFLDNFSGDLRSVLETEVKVKVRSCIAVNGTYPMTQLRSVTCHMV